MPIRLVVGLGNPGSKYRFTRHNVGFQIVERLNPSGSWERWGEWGEFSRASWGSPAVYLVRPLTFMNASGPMVRDFGRFHRISPAEILVCYDDYALPLGAIRIRLKGSAGGHNGMRSVLEALGTAEVPRLRVGVGPIPTGMDPVRFVLTRMAREEEPILADGLQRGCEAVRIATLEGIEPAMNRFNTRGEASAS